MFREDPQSELNNLAMSEKARPLLDAVIKHMKENVDPITEEFHRLGGLVGAIMTLL